MEHWKNLSLENLIEEVDGVLYVEEWRPVIEYEGLYEVSSFGRIRSLNRDLISKANKNYRRKGVIRRQQIEQKRGYLTIKITKDNLAQSWLVHRLVGLAWIPNQDGKLEINHSFGDKKDNRSRNLEWSTGGENRLHAYHVLNVKRPLSGKFGKDHHTSKKIKQLSLDGELIKIWDAMAEADRAGLGKKSNISACCKGKLKQLKGFKWEYV